MRYTISEQKKIIQALEDLGYQVRYEKGVFESSACLLKEQNIFVLNKFLDITSQINRLIEFLVSLNIDMSLVPSEKRKRIEQWLKAYETQRINPKV